MRCQSVADARWRSGEPPQTLTVGERRFMFVVGLQGHLIVATHHVEDRESFGDVIQLPDVHTEAKGPVFLWYAHVVRRTGTVRLLSYSLFFHVFSFSFTSACLANGSLRGG